MRRSGHLTFASYSLEVCDCGVPYEPTPSVDPALLFADLPGGDTKRLDQDLVVALPVVR